MASATPGTESAQWLDIGLREKEDGAKRGGGPAGGEDDVGRHDVKGVGDKVGDRSVYGTAE